MQSVTEIKGIRAANRSKFWLKRVAYQILGRTDTHHLEYYSTRYGYRRTQDTSFSKRYGYRPQPKEITVWEDAPESLRHFVLNVALELGYRPSQLRAIICDLLHVRTDPGNWSEYPNIWSEVESLVYGCEWFKFYDFVEKISAGLLTQSSYGVTGEATDARSKRFQDTVNEFFVDEGIGWKMVDREIVVRGTEIFESNVHGAVESLERVGRFTARDEIHEALLDLSRRPEADLTGAIQHAMAALECTARDICGDKRATLGEIIRKYPGTIPKPLDESIAKAWGFASERARHMREGHKPERAEVELIVGLAATVATYLANNHVENPNPSH